jgi:glutamyl-tRNA synthetase/glutamyl-Q tRNA(Asp) synthetase
MARARGGRVLLRVEDHDRQRCRAEYEAAMLDDLDWLGFEADIYPTREFRAGRCEGRQSDRDAAYRQAVQPLLDAGIVYACECARRLLDGPRYSGRCRERGLPLTGNVGWRVRVGDDMEEFDDLLLGPQRQRPAEQVGDFLIRDRLGNWTYQWAATADDTLQGVTRVVRGRDLLESTGRQLYLSRLLGRSVPPTFAHHPLLMKSPAQKLSKSDGDSGVRDLRAAGWRAEQVIGRAAFAIGLQPADTPLAARDVASVIIPLEPSSHSVDEPAGE